MTPLSTRTRRERARRDRDRDTIALDGALLRRHLRDAWTEVSRQGHHLTFSDVPAGGQLRRHLLWLAHTIHHALAVLGPLPDAPTPLADWEQSVEPPAPAQP